MIVIGTVDKWITEGTRGAGVDFQTDSIELIHPSLQVDGAWKIGGREDVFEVCTVTFNEKGRSCTLCRPP
jgi:hypothetical protein